MKSEIILRGLDDTAKLGQLLAAKLPPSCIVAMDGTLGAGKTRLAQEIAVACDIPREAITSPTFTIWQTYEGTRTIHHLDAYRMKDEDEFDALGVEECFDVDVILIVEWAGRVDACLPNDHRLNVAIDVTGENERLVTLTSASSSFEELAQALQHWA